MIFNPYTSQSFEEVLADVKSMLNIAYPPVTALYTATAPYVKVKQNSFKLLYLFIYLSIYLFIATVVLPL